MNTRENHSLPAPESPNNQDSQQYGKRKSLPPITVDGVMPYLITVRQLEIALGGQTKVVARLLRISKLMTAAGGWLEFWREGGPGQEALIFRDSADRACTRILLDGEILPPLPCEIKLKFRLPDDWWKTQPAICIHEGRLFYITPEETKKLMRQLPNSQEG